MLLSVCILLKDEVSHLRRLAEMVNGLADEILVVCDDPVSGEFENAADECKVRLVPHRWENDFAAKRNAGLQAARGEWVFWIDSDETIVAPEPKTFCELLGRKDVLGYYVTIEDLTADGAAMSPRQNLSLYRSHEKLRYIGRVHEHFDPPLETVATKAGMKVLVAPVRLQHTGYQPNEQPQKLQRNIRLMELELRDRPGQLYYLIDLGRSLLLASDERGHAVLAQAAELLQPLLSASQPQLPLAAALLEYTIAHAPENFPISKTNAVAASARWFPLSPPLAWRAARWHYDSGHMEETVRLLENVLKMGATGRYDATVSFDRKIFGDETRLNLGVCYAKLGRRNEALKQFRAITPKSPFFSMAKTNIERLCSNG
jgi:glycosyltransferase involved in cell wall biosynthesis